MYIYLFFVIFQDKVVILVTHQIQYLKEADQILVLHQGKITHQGMRMTYLKEKILFILM